MKKRWHNDMPLKLYISNYKELKNLNFNDFPIIENFSAELKEYKKSDKHLFFVNSENNTVITDFPWWDNADKSIKTMNISDIPLGTLSEPFDDLEQGWQILIFAKRDYVYVLEGAEPCCTEFHTWYRVRKEKYLKVWEDLIISLQ